MASRQGDGTIVIKARDFIAVEGWVRSSIGRSEVIEVWMRPLAEVTAAFAESPSSVLRWLEKGKHAAWSKVSTRRLERSMKRPLGAVSRTSWAKILQSMARTYYLEGNLEAAIRTLQWALAVDPADLISSQLYSNLLDQLGRGSEAAEFLGELRAKTPTELEELANQYSEALAAGTGREPFADRSLSEVPCRGAQGGQNRLLSCPFRGEEPPGLPGGAPAALGSRSRRGRGCRSSPGQLRPER